MTAPTSPKPPTPADPTVSKDPATTLDNEAADAGLRTALTKLADDAPTQMPTGLDDWERGRWTAQRDLGITLRALLAAHPAPAPVSDTRREDVARAIDAAHWETFEADDGNLSIRPTSPTSSDLADAVLALLPAPPVVDEAEVRERIAQDIEAVDPVEWALAGQRAGEDAARIARGATR